MENLIIHSKGQSVKLGAYMGMYNVHFELFLRREKCCKCGTSSNTYKWIEQISLLKQNVVPTT